MKYIQVIENQVQGEPSSLPTNFQNISNFYVLPSEKLIEHGWYPVRLVENPNKTNTTKFVDYTFVVENNEVVQYENIREKTPEEIQEETDKQWIKMRAERNKLLFISDWTQLSDSPLTNEKKQDWQTYRQQLRDVTNQTDPFNIIWPIKPE